MRKQKYDPPTRFTFSALNQYRRTKGELFQDFTEQTGIKTFDYALKQNWLDNFAEWCKENRPAVTYHLISSTTVWAYPEGYYGGKPISVCVEVDEALNAYSNAIPF